MGIPDHLTCLLRNLYTGQEATVRTGHGTTDWFQIRKGVCQGCILSPCLFNLSAEYIMQNAGLDEAQAGIKIPRRNINNLRYADDTTLMEESKKELKSLLMRDWTELNFCFPTCNLSSAYCLVLKRKVFFHRSTIMVLLNWKVRLPSGHFGIMIPPNQKAKVFTG